MLAKREKISKLILGKFIQGVLLPSEKQRKWSYREKLTFYVRQQITTIKTSIVMMSASKANLEGCSQLKQNKLSLGLEPRLIFLIYRGMEKW